MSSLAIRRARERYFAKQLIPLGGGEGRVGTIGVWIAGIGVVLLVMWTWNLLAMFNR